MKHLFILFFLPSFVFSQHTQKDPNTGIISKYASNGNILERYKLDNNGYYHGKIEKWYKTNRSYENPKKKSVESYKNGRPYGKQMYWYKNGQLESVSFKDDDAWQETYGEYKSYHENGQQRFYSIRDRKGRLIGPLKRWTDEGTLIKYENYKDGKKHGSQKMWDDLGNGELLEHFNYRDGKKHGFQKEWEWMDHAGETRLSTHYNYQYGKKHGEQKEFYTGYPPYLEKVENYKNGEKHGVFRELNHYGNTLYEENWLDGKKHGKFFSVDVDWGFDYYEENYKYGKKHGICIYYHEPSDNEDPTFQGIKKIENWKDGKLNGLKKEWGDNCYDDANSVSYPELPKYNLILEENYKDGKKDGICKYWEQGSHGDVVEHSTIDHEGFEQEWTTGGDWKEGDFIEEVRYMNGEKTIMKHRRYDGWLTRNHGGMHLDYSKFQDKEFISDLDEAILHAQSILLTYQSSIDNLNENLKLNVIQKQTLEESIIQIEKEKNNIDKNFTEYKNIEIGFEKINKINDKQKKGKINKKQAKILNKIDEFKNSQKDLENQIRSKKQELIEINLAFQKDSMKLSYYAPFPNELNLFVRKNQSLKDLELKKNIYDITYEYPKEYYSDEYVRRLGRNEEAIEMFNLPFNITKNNIGPFFLGMTIEELQLFLETDNYFNSNATDDEGSCAFICDSRVSIDTLENDSKFGDLIFSVKYEAYTDKEWYRPNFWIYLRDNIVHTILYEDSEEEEADDNLRLVESNNGIYFLQNFNQLLLDNPDINEKDIFLKYDYQRRVSKYNIKPPYAYFFDDKTGIFVCLNPNQKANDYDYKGDGGFDYIGTGAFHKSYQPNQGNDDIFLVTNREVESWVITRFLITSNDDFQVNQGLNYKKVRGNEMDEVEIKTFGSYLEIEGDDVNTE